MFVDSTDFIATELDLLRCDPRWADRWSRAFHESPSIVMPPCAWAPSFSGNIIHQASHLQAFERVTGANVSKLESVLEFGGGYGGLCGLLHRIGFSGRYSICDLPEFGALQRFYLAVNGIGSDGHPRPAPDFIENPASLATVNRTPDLFVALWSISETPESLRRLVLDAVEPRYWLIGFQRRWDKIDNQEFFGRFSETKRRWKWSCEPLAHIPSQYYLVGMPSER